MDPNPPIDQLKQRLANLEAKQYQLNKEISELRTDLQRYINAQDISKIPTDVDNETPEIVSAISEAGKLPPSIPPIPQIPVQTQKKKHTVSERYIGENLISKIGIAVLVIGVGIGAKYSIDHNLISPLTRILLGYLVGIILAGLGLKLKKTYPDFSAVLVSGATAILYFITYAAYDFYGFLPQMVAFGMMVLFTGATVYTALHYNRQVIAHIGLVGAYAVPFLLSADESNAAVLFSYMAIINAGILFLAIRKYWKSLYYSSFILTWVIFGLWYSLEFKQVDDQGVFWIFSTIFFITFYLIFLVYKLRRQEKFQFQDVLLILSNSFIFYGFGYAALTQHYDGDSFLGLFTLANAFVHFLVCALIYKQQLYDRNLFYMVAGMVLIFITIAVPVQLDGNWVTLLWAGEAAVLFWIGRTRKVAFYENISLALMLLAFVSMINDWNTGFEYWNDGRTTISAIPFFNTVFLTSLLFIGAFGFIQWVHKRHTDEFSAKNQYSPLLSFVIPGILLIAAYFTFRNEIAMYWDKLYWASEKIVPVEGANYNDYFYNQSYHHLKNVSIMIYTMIFFAALLLISVRLFENKIINIVLIGFSALTVFVFLIFGLYELSELTEEYLNRGTSHFSVSNGNIWVRYITYLAAALLLYAIQRKIRGNEMLEQPLRIPYDLLLHTAILWVASSELINWMNIIQSVQSNKLVLSILWGIYCLLLIALGIWKNKKHLRIAAIALFGVTLIKLVFYDLTHLDTLSKTIVFVSLGLLLLVISFLYNKYKPLAQNDMPDGSNT